MKKTTKVEMSPVPPVENKNIGLSFPDAMFAIIAGEKIRRREWLDEAEFCLLKDNFLTIHRNDKFHGWIVSEGDMLATDWVIT